MASKNRFNPQRRLLLLAPIIGTFVYFVGGLFSGGARAANQKIWRINTSAYSSGIMTLFSIIKSNAKKDGLFPLETITWLFPLNPTTPDGINRIIERGNVKFTETTAISSSKYESIDFDDAIIREVTTIIPVTLSANYSVTEDSVSFVFAGDFAQVIIWKIPGYLNMPKSHNLNSIEFKGDQVNITLTNTVNKDLLRIELFTTSVIPGNSMASEGYSLVYATYLLAAGNNTTCCQGNCYRDDGAIGDEEKVTKQWAVVKRMTPPNAGACSVYETGKGIPPPGPEYKVLGAGYLSAEKASVAMSTVYKKDCTPP